MEYLITFFSGVTHKLYDDIHDNNVEISPLNEEILKVLMTTLMTCMFLQNPVMSAFFLIIICIYWFVGKIDLDFWKACISIPVITTIITFNRISLTIFDIVFIFVVGGIMYCEDGVFPEETSLYKSIFRFGLSCVLSYICWIINDNSFAVCVSLFLIGYLLSNIIFHLLYKNNQPLKKEVSSNKLDHNKDKEDKI